MVEFENPRPLTEPPQASLMHTGSFSHIGSKLRDWAIRQARAGFYSWAEVSTTAVQAALVWGDEYHKRGATSGAYIQS